ncbi:MAG: preprotein translocase subunit SecG [Candidatus Omnitrophica bacterium]|nr:preprotein translocase subunit SecG [Candidatus Omnitrophota bacterium]MCM8808978.1 preprotein translocase subunit SecG [Candidatus Omnitrophota bacterium]MCM8833067.1 preprotein translocase subunit SecG [Candidatus Omnitrophota bacterium]
MYIMLLIIHILVSLFLIFSVLIQSGKGSSMANIFGGGGMENVFGAETPAILNKITSFLAIMFIITSVLLAIIPGKLTTKSILKEELNKSKRVVPINPSLPPEN